MKDQNTIGHRALICYLSFFYTGYTPKVPGTAGSIASLPLLLLISIAKPPIILFIISLILITVITCIWTHKLQQKLGLHDPQWIVIDEVLGMMTAWLFIYPSFTLTDAIAILVTFRIFDIVKIGPASLFDRLEHGSGTILDDIVSGVFAGFVLLAGKIFLPNLI